MLPNTKRLKKIVQNQNNNLLLSFYNFSNLKKNLKLKNMQLILRFNVETKNLKKISYEMFLSFFFLMFLYVNQIPSFTRLKKRDNIYIDKLIVDINTKNIYNTIDKFILFVLSTIRKEESIRFRNINTTSISLYLQKLNIFFYLDKFPILQEFLKYESDILNFKINFNFRPNSSLSLKKKINYLRLLQFPITRLNCK